MLTITIFAAGLVCLAGVLGIRLGQAQAQVATATAGTARASAEPTPTTADERGITLQTLIVTAVLVLMAVAAGVVIVAITNNAADDLEETAPAIDSTCEHSEVYDPVQAARGAVGKNGLAEGSAVGCIPVCFKAGSMLEVVRKPSETFRSTESDAIGTGTNTQTIFVPPLSDGRSGALYKAASQPESHTGANRIAHWQLPTVEAGVSFDRVKSFCYTETDRSGNPVANSDYLYIKA